MEGTPGVQVRFFGVRGSTPCCSDDLRRYGGNTSCVVVEADGQEPIVLDMGTGIRAFGAELMKQPDRAPFGGAILLTHLHWDHVQGLPFFVPCHDGASRLDIFGPAEGDRELHDIFEGMMSPPYFPICCGDLLGDIRFHSVSDDDVMVGDAKVRVRPVPHVGLTNGYRIEINGVSIAYIPDHQEPVDQPNFVDPAVLELCDGVDLLIHDAQFTPEEFAQRADWGHCTANYAVEVARQSGARTLALFHHDPGHDDECLDALHLDAAALAEDVGVEEVISAREGLTIELGTAQ